MLSGVSAMVRPKRVPEQLDAHPNHCGYAARRISANMLPRKYAAQFYEQPVSLAWARFSGSIIQSSYRERSNSSSFGVGFQGLAHGLVMPALSQNAVNASRFIFRFVLTYRLVVAILACPR